MTATVTQPDEMGALRQSRPAVGVLLLTVFINLVGFGIVIPLLPFYAQAFHAPPWQVTLVFAAFSLGNFFAEPFWGRLSDRIGRRPILIGTIFAGGLSFIGLAYAPGIWAACLIRLFGGLTTGNLSTIQGYIADVTPPSHRAGRMGFLGGAYGLGFMIGPFLGGALAQPELGVHGFRLPLFIAAGLSFLAALGVMLFVRESPTHVDRALPQAGRFEALHDALRHPVLKRVLLITLASTAAFSGTESTFGLWSQHRYGWGPHQVGWAFAVFGVTSALAQGFLTGRLARQFGEAAVLAGGLAVVSVTLFLQRFAPGPGFTLALMSLTAVGLAMVMPNVSALVSRATPSDRQGAVLGLNMAVGALARVGAPLYAGAAFSFLGANVPLYISAAIVAPAVWLSLQAERAARTMRKAS